MSKDKVETIDEFLKRGGKIKRFPYVPPTTKHVITPTTKQHPQIMSLDEGALFFSEKSKHVSKKFKEMLSNDNSLIPEDLRNKLMKGIKDEQR